MRPWCFCNTTVRSPFRLQDALAVYMNSSLIANIKGRDNENAFAKLLHNTGILNIVRTDSDASDLGRKWRSGLSKLGFIYPDIPAKNEIQQVELGVAFTITPNGKRLLESDTVAGMQECFLRSLSAYYIPSITEDYKCSRFSPLRHTLAIMLELERQTGESRLNFLEMALFVQMTNADTPFLTVVKNLLTFRTEYLAASNKRRFSQQSLESAASQNNYVPGTFKDYADTNFRYLKATGLVQSKGRGVAIIPEKKIFIDQLVADTKIPVNDLQLFKNICNGASLPTDNKKIARMVLDDLVTQLNKREVSYTLADRKLESAADIAVVRHDIEGILSKLNEEEYALRQSQEWGEIAEYMGQIIKPRRKKLSGDEDLITIPQAEAPAYFEWVLWRAFLAIDSLVNSPYQSRRFKIDQDFLPVGTAPGGGPDLVFEFADFVVVVEVTLTESSRQEAAEGEPVRRHVANEAVRYSEINDKPVYGLFIANKIDSNTAETFRIGGWYDRNDKRMRLDIVPLTLMQFKAIFEAMFKTKNIRILDIRELLDTCSLFRVNLQAPEWKTEIEKIVASRVSLITGS